MKVTSVLVACMFILFVNGQCINYSFKCCDIVDYPVWAITAATVDTSTCVTLDVIYSQNSNWTKDCQDAFADAYCVTAIPECCNNANPVVYTPCSSLCDTLLNECSGTTNTTGCGSPVWYDPPCNDGNGGPCPSSDSISSEKPLTGIALKEHLTSLAFKLADTFNNRN